jgi:hypothetical protein
MTGTHQPDIEWLLVVLSTLQPNHRFFGKSYYPSDEELGGRGQELRIITKPSMTSFSTISLSICRRPNTPKNLMLQIDFLNQGMIYKSIRAVSGKRIEKSKKLPI